MRTLTIINKARQLHVVNLPFQILGPGYVHRMAVGSLMWRNNAQVGGLQKGVRGGVKRVSKSIRIMPKGMEGDTVVGLPPRARHCPDVRALERRGLVELVELTATETAVQAAEIEAKAAKKEAREKAKAEHLAAKKQAKIEAALQKLTATAAPAPARRRARPAPPPVDEQ